MDVTSDCKTTRSGSFNTNYSSIKSYFVKENERSLTWPFKYVLNNYIDRIALASFG